MHWIDGTVLGVYLVAMLGIGIWLTRGVKVTEDFFLAGRQLPFWAIAMSLVVSDIGALSRDSRADRPAPALALMAHGG
jgi:SSS family solute:Na+ symporter